MHTFQTFCESFILQTNGFNFARVLHFHNLKKIFFHLVDFHSHKFFPTHINYMVKKMLLGTNNTTWGHCLIWNILEKIFIYFKNIFKMLLCNFYNKI
jgi:hypothetical protein